MVALAGAVERGHRAATGSRLTRIHPARPVATEAPVETEAPEVTPSSAMPDMVAKVVMVRAADPRVSRHLVATVEPVATEEAAATAAPEAPQPREPTATVETVETPDRAGQVRLVDRPR